jgi:hypothetical protein
VSGSGMYHLTGHYVSLESGGELGLSGVVS